METSWVPSNKINTAVWKLTVWLVLLVAIVEWQHLVQT